MNANGYQDLFAKGFDKGLELWRAGHTAESISHEQGDHEAVTRGLFAASEALMGWFDLASREARAWGFSRDAADRLVETARDAG